MSLFDECRESDPVPYAIKNTYCRELCEYLQGLSELDLSETNLRNAEYTRELYKLITKIVIPI